MRSAVSTAAGASVVVARMAAAEIMRRRTVVILTVLLPLWFYLVRRDLTGQSVRFLALGIGWSISTLTLFVVNAARGVDPRLRVTGLPLPALLGGRLLATSGGGVLLALGYWGLVAVDQDVRRLWAVGPMMLCSALVAAPFGALIGALLPRELEGALALLTVVAVQMLADPAAAFSRVMPFWSTREIANYAIDPNGIDYLTRGLLHAAATWTLCVAGTFAVAAWRLRLARYPEPGPEEPGRGPGSPGDPAAPGSSAAPGAGWDR